VVGKAMFRMLAAKLSEMEKYFISEHARAGLKSERAKGRSGRPK
jgi:DNA invertase Pin-like site-specific DNA recombinase